MTKAREDLAWFFGSSEGEAGLQAQGYERGDAVVWDSRRINALHVNMLTRSRWAIARRNRIEKMLQQVGAQHVADLRLVYTPFGWGRLSAKSDLEKDRANWMLFCLFSAQGRQLLPLALETPEMHTAYERRHDGLHCESRFAMLRFVRGELSSIDPTTVHQGKALPSGHSLAPALRAADRRETEAATAYSEIRHVSIVAEARQRRAKLDEEIEALHARECEAIERRLARKRASG